jgi:hypothetical protein
MFLSSQSTTGSPSETHAASVLERVCELAGEVTRSNLPGALNTPATKMEPGTQTLRTAPYIRSAARVVEGLP